MQKLLLFIPELTITTIFKHKSDKMYRLTHCIIYYRYR
jgi:hypothetical protein